MTSLFIFRSFSSFLTLVCVGVLTKFQEYAGKDVEDMEKSEAALIKFCKTLKGKEDSFVSQIYDQQRKPIIILSLSVITLVLQRLRLPESLDK